MWKSLWIPLLLTLRLALSANSVVHFNIDASQGNNTEFGLSAFVETNVNRADDGGLYAELIQNRAFQEQTSYLTIPGWNKVGGVSLYQDPDAPFHALKQSLQIYILPNASAPVGTHGGVNNTGWFGIPIKPQSYNASFWIKTDSLYPLKGSIQISLASLTTGKTYASASFDSSVLKGNEWHQLTATLTPKESAPDSNNVFSILFDIFSKPQAAWINLISLFPPTWKSRPNGLRPDLAQAIADIKPKHVRIPGGSNLQGSTIPNRFNWSATLGPLEDRPGRPGYWVGYQTEGLGLKELLDMVEDFGATPVLGIYDGYAADDESIPNTPLLDKYIEDAVNELHFVLGDSKKNNWAKLRADLGHPEPYKVEFVEIGNEDFTSNTYDYRWQRFYEALHAAYPNVSYIATATIQGEDLPAVDLHDFSGPDFFYNIFDRYDNWPRNGTKIWELENGVINTNSTAPFSSPDTRLTTPTLEGSIAEAVFAIGLQRNGDLVVGMSYAPYLSNAFASQWTPNLIQFNVSDICLSTSYYVHQMISHARADKTHPVQTSANFRPLYWVASSVNETTFFFQIANIGETPVPFTATIQHASKASRKPGPTEVKVTATVLSSSPGQPANVTNSLAEGKNVKPQDINVSATMQGQNVNFSGTVPGRSFSVYRVDLR